MFKDKKKYLLGIVLIVVMVIVCLLGKKIEIEPEVNNYLPAALENYQKEEGYNARIDIIYDRLILDFYNNHEQDVFSRRLLAGVYIKQDDGWHMVKTKSLLSDLEGTFDGVRKVYNQYSLFGGLLIKGEYIFDFYFCNTSDGQSHHIYYTLIK